MPSRIEQLNPQPSKSSNMMGISSLNLFNRGMEISRMAGCAAGAQRRRKKCRHSRRFIVQMNSVLRLFGSTLRASSGFAPKLSISKYARSALTIANAHVE